MNLFFLEKRSFPNIIGCRMWTMVTYILPINLSADLTVYVRPLVRHY